MAVLFVALGVACASGGESVTGDRSNTGGVTQTFTARPAETRVGQSVQLSYKLVNNTGNAVDLVFTSGKRYDFWVTSQGDEVWRWSDGMVFTQSIITETLDGQTGRTFTEAWTPDESGSYVVHARLTADGYGRELTATVEVG